MLTICLFDYRCGIGSLMLEENFLIFESIQMELLVNLAQMSSAITVIMTIWLFTSVAIELRIECHLLILIVYFQSSQLLTFILLHHHFKLWLIIFYLEMRELSFMEVLSNQLLFHLLVQIKKLSQAAIRAISWSH